MNKLVRYSLYSLFIVVVWNIIRFFLETIYVNKLTESYINFVTKYYLNLVIFVFCFLLLFIIEPIVTKFVKKKFSNLEINST